MSERHMLMDGSVYLYRRENSHYWQCAAYISRHNHRVSTRQSNLLLAIEFAREWYFDRSAEDRIIRRGGTVVRAEGSGFDPDAVAVVLRSAKPPLKETRPTFREAATAFIAEFKIMTAGERNAHYVNGKSTQLELHLLPFFGDTPVAEVTAAMIQDYRVRRATPMTPEEIEEARAEYKKKLAPGAKRSRHPRSGKPARSTLHSEFVTLRQVLKTANRKGWIAALPDMSAPYKASGKVSHRAWFSPEEYRRLNEETRERARNPINPRWRTECEKFHDYVLFMVNTGLRPDEAGRLEYRDVKVVVDQDTGERILEIEVRGKRGVGHCKSMPGAVTPLQRMRKRFSPKDTDLIWGKVQNELLNAVLDKLDLKTDRDGKARTAYSLRHTYICLRLMEGADIYQVAKNCRTSVEMIEKLYAAHIKNVLDASAINVRRTPRSRKGPSAEQAQANA